MNLYFRVLAEIRRQPGQTATEIAAILRCAVSSVNTLSASLARGGLIRRTREGGTVAYHLYLGVRLERIKAPRGRPPRAGGPGRRVVVRLSAAESARLDALCAASGADAATVLRRALD